MGFIWNCVKETVSDKAASASEFMDDICEVASEAASDFGDFANDINTDITNIKNDMSEAIKEKGRQAVNKTVNVSKEAYEGTKEFVKNAPEKIKKSTVNMAKKTSQFAKETYDDPSAKANKVWNGCTGQTTFDKAEDLLQKIVNKYDKALFEYKKDITRISLILESKISTINYHKKDIFHNHFKRFKNTANRLHNLDIDGSSFLEYFDDNITKIKVLNGVKSKDELYQIDFNNLSYKEMAFGILSLGFFTRKKAKQTLIKVEEEEIRINEEIEKMTSQIRKMNVIVKSIDSVVEYFTLLIQNYTKLLDRFEYAISSQTFKVLLNTKELKDGKLNFKLMPIVHIEEFQALFNLSIVLKQMAIMGYLTDDGGINITDEKAVNDIKYKIEQNKLLAS